MLIEHVSRLPISQPQVRSTLMEFLTSTHQKNKLDSSEILRITMTH